MTGAAFAFVGLELRAVAAEVDGQLQTLVGQALIVTAVVIVVRFVWIFPVAAIDEKARLRRNKDLAEPVGWREMAVASWAGMRGVVTLVAALALPQGFPERDRLIFVAFVVISVTLLLQGLTLPWLVRRLGVSASDAERDDAEQQLIRRAREAGFHRLDELPRPGRGRRRCARTGTRRTPTGCGIRWDSHPTVRTPLSPTAPATRSR